MTKNKAEKERKRAKRKQAERARDQQRKAANRRAAELLIEGIEERTPRGLAAVYSIPNEAVDVAPYQPRLARVPPPPHFTAMKALLDRCGATRYIEKFADVMFEVTLLDGALPTGVAVICRADQDAALAPIAMPAQFLFIAPAPQEWLARELAARKATAIAWLTWDFTDEDDPIPVIFAQDIDGNIALWFVDEENNWHPASQPQQYFAAAQRTKGCTAEESGIGDLLEICGATPGANGPRASTDDPKALVAFEVITRSQEQLLQAFFYLAQQNEESDAVLDYVAAENERIGTLERDLAKLERRLEQTAQERDQARSGLERERANSARRPKGTAPRAEVGLIDRLGSVFA